MEILRPRLVFFWPTLTISLFLVSLKSWAILGEVTVYKYWHLSSKENTKNIEQSKKLEQYLNQKKVYEQLNQLIKKGKYSVLITEGCEGEIDEQFTESFNNWTYKDLKLRANNSNFSDILTLVALKLKVKHGPRLRVICGDQIEKINATRQKFDELEGALIQLNQLKKNGDKKGIKLLVSKALKYIQEIQQLTEERNQSFLQTIKAHLPLDPVVVLGGGHLEGITNLMYAQKNIAFKVVETPGYPQEDEHHLERLANELKGLGQE